MKCIELKPIGMIQEVRDELKRLTRSGRKAAGEIGRKEIKFIASFFLYEWIRKKTLLRLMGKNKFSRGGRGEGGRILKLCLVEIDTRNIA